MDYMLKYAIADCAAQVLAQAKDRNSPCRGPEYHGVRAFLSEQPVKALRWLWKTGDRMDRHLVAARVLIWLGQDEPRRQRVLNRLKRTPVPTVGPPATAASPGAIYVTVEGGVVESVDHLPAGQELIIIDLDIDKDSDPQASQPNPLHEDGPRCLLDHWPK
jgi:hypothetical protein